MGSDSFADLLTKQLEGSSVNFSALQVGPGASGMSVAIVEASGEYGAAVVSGENTNIDETLIKIPENTGVLLLQNEISETVNLEIAKKLKLPDAKFGLMQRQQKKLIVHSSRWLIFVSLIGSKLSFIILLIATKLIRI